MVSQKTFVRAAVTIIALLLVANRANVLFFSKSANGAKFVKTISWADAEAHYGENVTVEGEVSSVYKMPKVCFLRFDEDRKSLTAVIFARSFPDFPPSPEDYYKGKRVKITGLIKKYKGNPEIILDYPGQIEITGKD